LPNLVPDGDGRRHRARPPDSSSCRRASALRRPFPYRRRRRAYPPSPVHTSAGRRCSSTTTFKQFHLGGSLPVSLPHPPAPTLRWVPPTTVCTPSLLQSPSILLLCSPHSGLLRARQDD